MIEEEWPLQLNLYIDKIPNRSFTIVCIRVQWNHPDLSGCTPRVGCCYWAVTKKQGQPYLTLPGVLSGLRYGDDSCWLRRNCEWRCWIIQAYARWNSKHCISDVPTLLLAVLVKKVENLRDQRGIPGNRFVMVAAGNFYIGMSHLQLFHARDPAARQLYR